MSFLSILGKIGHVAEAGLPVAGTIIGTFNPAIGGLINIIGHSVIAAEQNHATEAGAGATKKSEVMADLQIFAPAIALIYARSTGNKVDVAQLLAASSKITDDIVALLNLVATSK